MLTLFLKLLRTLNSEAGPWQISFAAGLALIIGLTPVMSLHNVLILLFAFVFRVNLATFFALWAIFSGFAYLLDPLFDRLGYQWLMAPGMADFWTGLYQNDFWQLTRFNHTVTLGSLAVSLVLFVPVVLLFRYSVVGYRAKVMPTLERIKIVQALKASKLYDLYQKLP
ncbi:TIGR03546 family protein [Saccharospirillum mangrovi]|uniref:TIGR03546 family protein n=1 Tax=Saccharospirillum mangrovi TaxID=2161747 RepID=UPI000D3BD7C7|nr:TIGR03546 family protein [Saccharospirillum mangrovi]